MSPKTRILAIDPGKVRIGLAVSDAERRLASPLTVYSRKNDELDAQFFRATVADEDIGLLLVGLPVHTTGNEGVQAQAARSFGAKLQSWTELPCVFYDERFTTQFAESELWNAGLTHRRRKERRDKVAAQMLLQSYLEAGCPPAADAKALDA
ncbi:MAG: Holliday junction resolvase RuvX [Gemmataceae bacterium]|nr:Holliday junction resolvase RuvX [Gemmataceae bacterium]